MTHIHMIQLFPPIPASQAGGLIQTVYREQSLGFDVFQGII